MQKCTRYSAEFKAKVAKEAIKGEETWHNWPHISVYTSRRFLRGNSKHWTD